MNAIPNDKIQISVVIFKGVDLKKFQLRPILPASAIKIVF